MATTTSNPNRQNCGNEPHDCTHSKPEPPTVASSNVGQSSARSINCSTQVGNKRKTIKSIHQSVPFTVSHWNCASGITNKLHDIKLAISELKPTVLFIYEANIKIIMMISLSKLMATNYTTQRALKNTANPESLLTPETGAI